MKELLSFLAAKTQSLAGQKFVHLEDPGTGALIAQERLSFFAEAFNSLRPDTDIPKYIADLDDLKLTDRVVVFEAAIGAAIRLDVSHPREYARSVEFIDLAPDHIAGLGLGAGHALASLKVEADITPALSEHYLGWMAMDAYGFHAGYFNWFDCVHKMKVPLNLPPIAMTAYHQGLGRGIWFIGNGDPKAVQQIVERFPLEHRPDLWRGIGLMTCFWGAKDEAQLKQYFKISKQFRPFLQQGAAQGVSMRTDMGEVVEETEAASTVLCGAPAADVAAVAKECMMRCTGETFDSRSYLSWQDSMVEFFVGQSLK